MIQEEAVTARHKKAGPHKSNTLCVKAGEKNKSALLHVVKLYLKGNAKS